MIIEGISIALIIGSCGFIAWIAKNKFQPQIEREIEKQKQQEIKLSAKVKTK
ncbi:MAG TPA: hypothetical protein VJ697_14810 [Nitrososphaeraceae archaeon]|nr:hypothetical protein [Nitrososphaeraceae archaeon]